MITNDIIKNIINTIKSLNMSAGDWATWVGSIGTVGTLIYTLKQLQITREESIEQNKATSIERFESALFNLLSFHNDIVVSIDDGSDRGRKYFFGAYNELYSIISSNVGNKKYSNELSKVQDKYSFFYSHHQEYIGHYFRNLYHIIKFIDKSDNKIISPENKKYYVSLVRAQLSTYELLLIFYNSISIYGEEKFLPLIKEYDLLQNINWKKLINPSHKEIFDNFNSI